MLAVEGTDAASQSPLPATVVVPVSDQDEALAFNAGVLGMRKVSETSLDIKIDICSDIAPVTPDPQSNTVADLILKALDSLTASERRQVLSALIRSGLSPVPASYPVRPTMPPLSAAEGFSSPGARVSASGPPAVLPVRLPPDQLEQLRSWCADHGFSMAVVIRGLVERFLESQRL